ncbi:MAG TPA: flagellar basal body P-ring formation chaperone FlgA [Methylophilus sp.]|nr:flagellar basal body P-ring formation chaperone FlgA [Methylophilus sp.]HQQ32423.1 flagellar basal body P-ring formation chaperone FlgA [Methylophilus sp.]
MHNTRMMSLIAATWTKALLKGCLSMVLFGAGYTFANTDNLPARQNMAVVKEKIEAFLLVQTAGYPGKVSVTPGVIDPNLKLAQCTDPEVFLPPGSRAWGKTTVGVRCNTPSIWTIYVQAKVNVRAQYLVAALPLAQGHVMTTQDVTVEEGDLTQLPAGVFTDANQLTGRLVSISMTAGTILRQDMLKLAPVVQQGQTILLTSNGKGFSVTNEGKALNNAGEGQIVQVKVASGQVVSGIARAGGRVEVSF